MMDESLLINVSEFYQSERFSDVSVVLTEEPSSSLSVGSKRKLEETCTRLPCHSMVLMGYITWFKSKLTNWSTSDGRPEIHMHVPEGQLAVGETLINGIYQTIPDLSGSSQAQLLQLLVLADRYGVPKVLCAAAAALAGIPDQDLSWETVMGVYTLPPGCTQLPGCRCLYEAVAVKLLQHLGDLELADRLHQKQQLLLQLPHAALQQLLAAPTTQVASENTVFATIQRWHQHQEQHCSKPTVAEVQQLLQLVRMRQCTQLYVTTVMALSPLMTACFNRAEIMTAAAISGSGVDAADRLRALQRACPTVEQYPAWTAAKRPESAMQQLTFEWNLPLAELKLLVEQHQQEGQHGRTSTTLAVRCGRGVGRTTNRQSGWPPRQVTATHSACFLACSW